jgi:mediator of RNA polymerase II transcription subunit 13
MTVGLSGSVVKLSGAATPFWRTLGLGPAGGPKDLLAFALYESRGPGTEEAIKRWLEKVGVAYEVSHGSPSDGLTCIC